MHAASSVSELYAADEVDLLLDEIRHLEPTSCRPEELQDLDIAGSGGAGWGGSQRSWDSHAGYARARGAAAALAPLYCGWRRLLRGGALAGAAAAGAAAAAAALALAGAGRGAARAGPLAPRLRALQLAALWAALQHAALLAARVSRLHELLPLRWHLLTALSGAGCGLALLAAGAAALRALLLLPAPPPLLLGAASLCICGSVFSFVLLALSLRSGAPAGPRAAAYRAVPVRPPAAEP